jgi:hypothetical protein
MKPIACKAWSATPASGSDLERVFEPLIKSRNVRLSSGGTLAAERSRRMLTGSQPKPPSVSQSAGEDRRRPGDRRRTVQVNATLSRVRNCRIQFESRYGMST